MPSDLIASLLQAHRAGDLGKLEDRWLELVDDVPAVLKPLLDILDELTEWGESDRALAMLEVLVPPLRQAARFSDLLEVLQRIVALNPQAEDLGPDFAACYQHLHADCETIDLFIEKSRLRFARPIGPALEAMEVFLAFRRGEIVLHESGWGVGIVRGYDPLDAMLVVDFREKKGHRVSPRAAPKLLKKLDPDDFRALRVLDPARLEALARHEPVEIVRQVLAARNRESTAARIKATLVPDVIPARSWTSWWTKARKAAERDPLIRCTGSGASAAFSLRKAPADPVPEALAAFRAAGSRRKRVQLALDARRSVNADRIVPALVEVIRALPCEEPAARAEVHFLLEALGTADAERFDPAALADPGQALEVLTGIEHPELRARAYEAIRRSPMENRERFLKEAFYRVSPDLWDSVFHDLAEGGEAGRQTQAGIVSTLVLQPRSWPDRYGWLVHRALKGEIRSPALPDPPALLRKLLDAINHLHRHRSGEPDYRQRLARMEAAFTDKNGTLLDAVLDRCTGDEARGLRERFLSCPAFTEGLKRELGVRVARRHRVQADATAPAPASDRDAASLAAGVIWVSPRGLAARRAEYEKLVNRDIPRGQEALNRAASYGDLAENAEWTYALEQQGHMTRRAKRMEADFGKVRLIEAGSVPLDRMGLGSRGRFTDRRTGGTVHYTILGPWDADPERGILSYDSPLARQLLERKVGEAFTIELPNRRLELELTAIENGVADQAGTAAAGDA